ncbi:nucleoside hydrolase-like domain-containing protein [uncultured Draconibacterium sp.]|uniref:nucleoside hydrolase-like domain-containing protein n=1 Tax=uncultured Draconibacterium sp. TaxID=1573823 RepID=UPI003216C24A
MKIIRSTLSLVLALMLTCTVYAGQSSKPRVIVMTDGEIDDHCAMVRFLLYSNDMDIAAIIETNSVFQQKGWSSQKWIDKQIDAYAQVYPNLKVHDSAYPTPDYLKAHLYVGDEDPSHLAVSQKTIQRVPGMENMINPAKWEDTPGSDRIVKVLLEDDPRPVYIQAWGGGNTAARAFYKLKSQYPNDYERAVSKAVMYGIWYQDGAGDYIEEFHPGVTMLISYFFSGTWDYGSQPYTRQFVTDNLHNNHGALGAMYKQKYISEGDSPAFLYSLANGLRSYEHPTYGGWGGRFYKVPGKANVYRDVDKASYMRWVEYANRDFEARLKWCVAPKYEDANHKPVINIIGGLDRIVKSGELVEIEAKISDPDPVDYDALWEKWGPILEQHGQDKSIMPVFAKNQPKYSSLWWQYKEAGTYNGMVELSGQFQDRIHFVAPEVTEPSTIHLILEVKDGGFPSLTAFARVIITVVPSKH